VFSCILVILTSLIYLGVRGSLRCKGESEFLISTTDDIPGYRVVRVLGIVMASTVRARHLGRDIVASLRNVVGGEIKEYTVH